MNKIRLSFFGSCIRPHLWEDLLNSLRGGKYEYEVIFAGHIDHSLIDEMFKDYPEFKYIQTGEIKPATCYEIARRACSGDLVCWIADDCTFSPNFVDEIVTWFEPLGDVIQRSYILSCKTNENGQNETMENHRFFGRNLNTPKMAPIGVMRRDKLEKMGGIDSRYICGQYENDIVMRFIANGGQVLVVEFVTVNIDHANKHGKNNNFWSGYNEDREQLENSWCIGGYQEPPKPLIVLSNKHSEPPYTYFPISNVEVTLKRNDTFCPYPAEISLTESLSPKGIWR